MKKIIICTIIGAVYLVLFSFYFNCSDPANVVSGGAYWKNLGAVNSLKIDTGMTDINRYEPKIVEQRSFKVSWNKVDGADYYEVRVLPELITADNWDNAAAAIVTILSDSGSRVSALVRLQPKVKRISCTGCGICKEKCPQKAISISSGKALIDPAKCTSCGLCIQNCPFKSITDASLGKDYFFAVRAFSHKNETSNEVCSSNDMYRMRYFNYEKFCGRCGEGCYPIRDKVCPVDAIYFDPPGSPKPGMVHIDPSKCINCGKCLQVCYDLKFGGLLSIRNEVIRSIKK